MLPYANQDGLKDLAVKKEERKNGITYPSISPH